MIRLDSMLFYPMITHIQLDHVLVSRYIMSSCLLKPLDRLVRAETQFTNHVFAYQVAGSVDAVGTVYPDYGIGRLTPAEELIDDREELGDDVTGRDDPSGAADLGVIDASSQEVVLVVVAVGVGDVDD